MSADYVELIDAAIGGFENNPRIPYYSSAMWLAYQAGVKCRALGMRPQAIKKSRGYSVIVNRSIKFDFTRECKIDTLEITHLEAKP